MMKYALMIFLTLAVVIYFTACYYDNNEDLYPQIQVQQGSCDTLTITYNTTVKPIFDNYCVGCHGAGASFNFDGYTPLSSYLTTGSQKLIDNINFSGSQPMPPTAKLSSCYIRQIELWINAGYPNN